MFPQPLTEQVYMATPESETSYLTHALTPTSTVLDLGCTRAMTSWRAAKDLMEFCDQNPDSGLWYRLDQNRIAIHIRKLRISQLQAEDSGLHV